MSKNNYEDKLRSFVSNNADLIGEYESMDCALPIEYCIIDIIDNCQKLLKLDKTADFNKTLKDAFTESIRHHINVIDSFDLLINKFLSDSQTSNSTQQYFKEINDIYNRHNNEYDIEYCPENRDKLIEMNLKTVISLILVVLGFCLSFYLGDIKQNNERIKKLTSKVFKVKKEK